jgi:DNA primase
MIYDLIKSRVQIMDVVRAKVELKKRGGDYIGICPFHSEKTPSFTVNNIKGFFYCFGCQAGGDVIGFVSHSTGMNYRDAAFKLANDYKIELPSSAAARQELDEFEKIYSVMELALEFYRKNLTTSAIKYLNSRGISDHIIEKFQIGYAPSGSALRKFLEAKGVPLLMMDKAGLIAKKEASVYEVFRERIIFPIRNNYNKLIAFGGRAIVDIQPKYLNSPETLVFKKSESFYGENFAYTSCYKSNQAILVEGYMDLIAMHGVGLSQTLATLGTAVNEKHLEKLWQVVDEIVMCLDGDEAGIRASKRVAELALPRLKANKSLSFVVLPKGSDPDDVIKEKGVVFLESALEGRIALSQMIWKMEVGSGNFASAESIAKLESKLLAHVQHIADALVAKSYKRFFNDQIWNLNRGKKAKAAAPKAIDEALASKDDFLEIALIALLIECPELFDDQDVLDQISKIEFSAKYANFISPGQIEILAKDIVPIIRKNNPGFSLSLSKSDPKKVFLKMSKKYNLVLLKRMYQELAKKDPKKFLEIYDSYKLQIDQLLAEDD